MAEYIAFDELTHFTQEEYEYLKSRNRPNGPGTRVYMRATANGSSPWCGSAPIGHSADVAPVVHGEWLSWKEADNFIPSPDRHECSVCHDSAQVLVNGLELLSDYCPNCGARMDAGGA